MIRVAILAGGRSSRMGTDKAGLVIDGETLLTRTVRIATVVSGIIPLIVGRESKGDVPAQFVPDELPDVGPLGGLLTAFHVAPGTTMLALSCDLPALTEDALRWLLAQERGSYGVAARNGEQVEPLFAVYNPIVLPKIEANLSGGKRSLHGLIRACGEGFAIANAPTHVAAALANVNTAAEWETFLSRTLEQTEKS